MDLVGAGLVVIAIAAEWFGGWSATFAAAPINLGLFSLAMAHGAADAYRLWILRPAPARLRGAIAYMALLLASALFVVLLPAVAIVLFLPLAAWHFSEDVLPARELSGGRLSFGARLFLRAQRGGLVVFAPLLFHFETSLAFFRYASMVGASSDNTTAIATIFAHRAVRWDLLVVCLGLFLMVQGLWWAANKRNDQSRPICFQVTWQHSVLLMGAAILHPLFYVGLYLGGWHALRHLQAIGTPQTCLEKLQSFIATLFFLLPVLALVVAVWAHTAEFPGWAELGLSDFVMGAAALRLSAITFLAYAAVTWPHAWLDWRLRQDAVTQSVTNEP